MISDCGVGMKKIQCTFLASWMKQAALRSARKEGGTPRTPAGNRAHVGQVSEITETRGEKRGAREKGPGEEEDRRQKEPTREVGGDNNPGGGATNGAEGYQLNPLPLQNTHPK